MDEAISAGWGGKMVRKKMCGWRSYCPDRIGHAKMWANRWTMTPRHLLCWKNAPHERGIHWRVNQRSDMIWFTIWGRNEKEGNGDKDNWWKVMNDVSAIVFQSLSLVWFFSTPKTVALQAPLISISQSLLTFMSIELVMPSNYLTFCCPLLLLLWIFPNIRVFSKSQLFTSGSQRIGASASASVLSMNSQGWFSLRLTGLTSLQSKVEKAMAPHSSTLAWKIPRMEEPGRLQSMGSLRVRHDWVTSFSLFIFLHWRMQWQPTPVFLPGESQGRGSLLGCRLWGCTESDTTDVT